MTKLDASLLNNLRHFEQFDVRRRQEVLDLARVRWVPPGKPVFEEGKEASHFYLLVDGHVRVERLNAVGEKVISLHSPPGQLFGIDRALGRDHDPATALAVTERLTPLWPTAMWDRFVDRYNAFSLAAYRVAGNRVTEMKSRIKELAAQHFGQRVARVILRLVQKYGLQKGSGTQIACGGA